MRVYTDQTSNAHHAILAEDRNCVYCEWFIKEEFHFVLMCPLYNDIRNTNISEVDLYVSHANYETFSRRISSAFETEIRNLAMYEYMYNAVKFRYEFVNGQV